MRMSRRAALGVRSIPGVDAYTKSLLHMNGADGGTVFTDETGRTWTRNGNTYTETGSYKFGTASAYFDGTGDWLDTPDSDDFDIGSGDFTVDFWMRRAITGVNCRVLGQCDSASNTSSLSTMLTLVATDRIIAYVGEGSSTHTITSSTTYTSVSTWYHIALVRYGNTLTLYSNGTSAGSVDITGVTVNNSSNKFAIGRTGEYATNPFTGYIDEFRFSKGIARWTANFTPPTAPYGS